MPYKDKLKGQWIAQVTNGKKKFCRRCVTKKEAIEWEAKERERLLMVKKGEEEATPSISLLEWATAYLQYSQRQHVKLTFEEKRFAFKLLFKSVDPQLPVCELKTISVLKHLQGEEEKRSGN